MHPLERRSFLQLAALSLPAQLLAQTGQGLPPSGSPASGSHMSRPPMPAGPVPPLVHAGEDRYAFERNVPNGSSTFKLASADAHNGLFVMEHHHTAKGGPPRHYHHVEDEWFYVLEGDYLVEVGGKLMKLKAGDSALGPKGIPHSFAFVGNGSGRILILYAPAGRMEAYFDLREKEPGGFASYKPNPERMRAYGLEPTGPPLDVS